MRGDLGSCQVAPHAQMLSCRSTWCLPLPDTVDVAGGHQWTLNGTVTSMHYCPHLIDVWKIVQYGSSVEVLQAITLVFRQSANISASKPLLPGKLPQRCALALVNMIHALQHAHCLCTIWSHVTHGFVGSGVAVAQHFYIGETKLFHQMAERMG